MTQGDQIYNTREIKMSYYYIPEVLLNTHSENSWKFKIFLSWEPVHTGVHCTLQCHVTK
jgi:hypothetical protein